MHPSSRREKLFAKWLTGYQKLYTFTSFTQRCLAGELDVDLDDIVSDTVHDGGEASPTPKKREDPLWEQSTNPGNGLPNQPGPSESQEGHPPHTDAVVHATPQSEGRTTPP